MSEKITCPKCNSDFYVKESLKEQVTGFNSFIGLLASRRFRRLFSSDKSKNMIEESNLVICPNCGNEFLTEEYRFFGFLSKTMLRRLLIIFLLLFMAFPIYILIRDLLE